MVAEDMSGRGQGVVKIRIGYIAEDLVSVIKF